MVGSREVRSPEVEGAEDRQMKFRKKPIVVEATVFDPDLNVWPVGVERDYDREHLRPRDAPAQPLLYRIKTLEGWQKVTPGDWIITGIKGERYPCNPDIFVATYDPVES